MFCFIRFLTTYQVMRTNKALVKVMRKVRDKTRYQDLFNQVRAACGVDLQSHCRPSRPWGRRSLRTGAQTQLLRTTLLRALRRPVRAPFLLDAAERGRCRGPCGLPGVPGAGESPCVVLFHPHVTCWVDGVTEALVWVGTAINGACAPTEGTRA